MKNSFRLTLVSIFLSLGFLYSSGQTSVVYPATLAPAGMVGNSRFISFSISNDGEYLMAATSKEVRCWSLPEGELVYRFQAGRVRNGTQYTIVTDRMNCTVVNSFNFIKNGQYLRVSGQACGKNFTEIVRLPGGELLPKGSEFEKVLAALPDNESNSIQPDKIAELQKYPSLLRGESPKGCDKQDFSAVQILRTIKDPEYPENNLILYVEYLHCPKEYFKGKLEKSEYQQKILWKNMPGYAPSPYRIRYASVEWDGRPRHKFPPIGNMWFGSSTTFNGFISPNGEQLVIVDKGYGNLFPRSTYVYDMTGALLWQPPASAFHTFYAFGEYNNPWFIESAISNPGKKLAYVNYDIQTGKELNRIAYPGELNHLFIPSLNLMAVARNSESSDQASIITVHNSIDGGIVSVLTDMEAVESFSGVYTKERARVKAEEEARLETQRKWAEQQRQWNEAAKRRRAEKKAQDAKLREEEAANYVASNPATSTQTSKYKVCPECNGRGGEKKLITTYSTRPREVYNGFGGKTVFQDKSKPLFTDEKFIPCNRCWGKGEVRKY